MSSTDEAATVPPAKPRARPRDHAGESERYQLGDKLGEGAMGGVWAARDLALDRDVAFKVLHDELLGVEHQERLAAEARAMARLSHPNVVAVYDVGVREGRTYLTMELVRGSPLSAWLETPRTWRAIVEVFRGAAAGLAAAHAAGIVHRDVKPTNILVGDDGRARVADFGVAHAAVVRPGTSERVTTQTAGMIGSPAYMAPEQLAGEPSDARADQFGLCVSLYEALHGVRPFEADTFGGLLMAITRGAPPPRRPVPGWLHAVVARGLAAHPDARFPSMTALATALEGKRSRRWFAGIALGVAATTGVVAFVAMRDASTTSTTSTTTTATTAVTPDAAVGSAASSARGSNDDEYVRYLTDGIRAATEGNSREALELLDKAVPLEHGPPNALVWAARVSCELADEARARAYLAKIPKDTPKGRKGRLSVVVACTNANIDLRDAVSGESLALAPAPGLSAPGLSAAKSVAGPVASADVKRRPKPASTTPPASELDAEQRRVRFLDLTRQMHEALKRKDHETARARALEAMPYAGPNELEPVTIATTMSCRLGEAAKARETFVKLPQLSIVGRKSRHTAAAYCEKHGISLLDLMDPSERTGLP